MWLDGTPIDLATTYSVTVNSFLASGGDNFTALAGGTNKQDTGKTDLQAMVDYMAEFADTTPLAVDYAQHAVGVLFPAGAPASYGVGRPREVRPVLAGDDRPAGQAGHHGVGQAGEHDVGDLPGHHDAAPPADANSNDEAGTASVDVVIPAGTPAGAADAGRGGGDDGHPRPACR